MIGARQRSFKPKTAWEDVILSEALKSDIRADMEGFFTEGVSIYRDLGLAPFRKLLFVGPPGTGKSTLCVALSKIALEQHGVVIYVSSSQKQGGDDTNFAHVHRALRISDTAHYPVLLVIEDLDAYLLQKDEKSQILNVLDGVESPNNPHGVLLVATTNYPEIIDERITKRPGRIDRIFYIPPIEDEDQALRMLKRYLGDQWRDEHEAVARDLIGQTGVFVREVALYARILAANAKQTSLSMELLKQSVKRLMTQLATGYDLQPRRTLGFGTLAPQTDREAEKTEIAARS
jgi:SpoVK/Ycf46/Vps4 family AAA+-type ATPase